MDNEKKYVWCGQAKQIGMWKDYKDGDLILASHITGDPRFEKWLETGVIVSEAKLKAEAKKQAEILEQVAMNRAKKAAAEAKKASK